MKIDDFEEIASSANKTNVYPTIQITNKQYLQNESYKISGIIPFILLQSTPTKLYFQYTVHCYKVNFRNYFTNSHFSYAGRLKRTIFI